MTSFITLLMSLHYLLSKRFKTFAANYASIQTLVITVGIIEKAYSFEGTVDNTPILTIILAIDFLLALISLCQRSLLIVYILCAVYIPVRLNFLEGGTLLTSLRFASFFIIGYICLYIFSRIFQQRERDHFKQKKDMKQILELFHSLLRVFHDGILLTKE